MKRETVSNELKKKRFRVTIFGSARIKRSSREYKDVYNLAKLIGEKNIDLITGGGPGVMKAASAGHKAGSKDNGAYTIGLGIKIPREQKINQYVDVKKNFKRFSERLDNFMLLSNVVIVTEGGVGTMLELFFTWQLLQVRHTHNIPIVLIGKQWKGLIKWLKKGPLKKKFFKKEDLELLHLAKNSNEAIKMIDATYKEYKKK